MSTREDKRVERREALWDFLVSRPDGPNIIEIAAELNVSRRCADATVREFRLTFGEDDDINLVCAQEGRQEKWRYYLSGSMTDDTERWIHFRLADLESSLETNASVLTSLIRGTDGRKIEGKKARKIHRAFSRALEDIADLNESADS